MAQTLGVRAMSVRIELYVIEIGRRISVRNFPDPVARTNRFNHRFFQIPRNRILIRIGKRNRNVERF